MASIKFGLDTRVIKDGMHPVRMRINNARTSAYISTGVLVEPSCFNPDSLREPITKSGYQSRQKNESLRAFVAKFDTVMDGIRHDDTLNISTITANDIRTYIIGVRAPKRASVKKSGGGRVSFLDWFDLFGQSRKTDGTRRSYAYIWRVLCEYCKSNGYTNLYFDELDYTIFVAIRKWLEDTGRGDSVRHQVEAYMHAAWREAKRMKMVKGDDPWEDYHIEKQSIKEDIDVIALKDLRRLLSLDLTTLSGSESLSKARDIMWASFCLCGVNLTDLYHMPKATDEEVVYTRRKNRNRNVRTTHAYITNDLAGVVERYAGENYLFRWQEEVPNYYTFQRRINERCSRLSAILGTPVNMQLIRRTWSTIAGDIGVDFHAVEKMTGHVDSSTTGKYYQRFNWHHAAKENKKVISYVLRGVVPNSIQVPSTFR